ncbi:MAG: hypothetical protein E6J30_00970 [Chloroflexi bacterium]|nr:MAG: hypothetical protein E6J30_00970 [Chloroflexota bacterium]
MPRRSTASRSRAAPRPGRSRVRRRPSCRNPSSRSSPRASCGAAQGYPDHIEMMMFHSAFALLFFVVPLVFVGLIALVVWAVTRPSPQTASMAPYGPPAAMPSRESPLDILARRLAAGEISADEYQKARDLLKGDSKS